LPDGMNTMSASVPGMDSGGARLILRQAQDEAFQRYRILMLNLSKHEDRRG